MKPTEQPVVGFEARTKTWDAQTTRPEALTASAEPDRRHGQVTLASGRVVRVDHGPDFATLIRADLSA